MKGKEILCLILIGLISFNLIGCIDNYKDIKQKNNQQSSISDSSSAEDEKNSNEKIKENQSKDTVTKQNTDDEKTIQRSEKQIYNDKLDTIQAGLKDLDELYAGNTIEMKSAESQEYERWDEALNEIYGVLKQQLSSDEMSKLKEEQIKWISDRDSKAKKASLEYEGGTAEQLVYISSLAKTTKERCYELVQKYIK